MRKIEQQMVAAIRAGKDWRSDNTAVTNGIVTGRPIVRLHGNIIAEFDSLGALRFTLAGWPTPTTRSRVNALLREFGTGRAYVCQSGGTQYYRWADELREIGASEWVTVQQ